MPDQRVADDEPSYGLFHVEHLREEAGVSPLGMQYGVWWQPECGNRDCDGTCLDPKCILPNQLRDALLADLSRVGAHSPVESHSLVRQLAAKNRQTSWRLLCVLAAVAFFVWQLSTMWGTP